jgi:hypothetical protein
VKKNSLILTTIFITTSALAESGGSVYSLFGIGDIRYSPSTRSVSMGYTGIALPSATIINGIQPATWSRISKARVDAGLQYEGYKSSDASRSLYIANSNFNGALLAIPISTGDGIVTVLGFTPYSNVDYNLFVQGNQAGVNYQLNHKGSGGVSRGLAGLSYSPFPDFSLGASFNYLFGSIENSLTFSPNDPSLYVGGVTTHSMSLHGIAVSFGAQFHGLDRISEALKPLALGVVITTGGNLKTSGETRYDFLSERDTIPSAGGRLKVPLAFGIGLGYQPSEQYVIAADYYAQKWGSATFNGINPPEIRDSYRIGVGGERVPERDARGWFGRLVYRLGLYYNSTYYRVNNEPINEWGVTGGLGIPLFGDARLNTAFEYGSRGTTKSGLVKDNIFRVSFSVSISESWFQRFEED